MLSSVDSAQELRDQIEEELDPHETSVQALGEIDRQNRHTDGESIYQDFGIPPFHKYLHRCERHEQNVATHPKAWIDPLVHVDEREIEMLELLADNEEVEYNPDDPYPSHEALEEDYSRTRGKLLEWLASDPDRVRDLSVGGTDIQIYGEPGSGKSTLAQFISMTTQQVNNETVLWADTLDDSWTNERAEWLPLAPWATIAVPEGIPVTVRVSPKDPALSSFELELEDICRDVIHYSSPRDLNQQLFPGQFYVVFPDPLLRGCEDVSRWSYHSPRTVTPPEMEGPDQETPINHWWFAYFATRISQDDFMHWTSVLLDEAGNLLNPDARKDAHDTYQKIVWWQEKFADARKKGVSIYTMCHALTEIHEKIRRKQRWWCTMNGMSPPINKRMPGDKKCPMDFDRASRMDKGEAQIWTTRNWANISWPNLKRKRRIDAEISIDFHREEVV